MATPIYHITHMGNLPAILAAGGLKCVVALRRGGNPAYTDIAHANIQDRRARKDVPCGPGGKLCDYVPFYFAPRSPMLYAIHKNNVAGYTGGQTPIVHLVASAEDCETEGLEFVFTDGHAVMEISRYFTELRYLKRIDWKVMDERYWNDTAQDGDRKRRRQAEFLVHGTVPWSLVAGIGVRSRPIAQQVQGLLGRVSRPVVRVRPEWYYW